MKPPPFAYHDPATVEDALGLLSRLENVRVLAGGQSVMPMLNMRFIQPDHLIDLNGISELSGIALNEHSVRIGAMTRQRALETHEEVAARLPLVREALELVGHRQTRNRGTVGGSLCHLDPAAELVAVALALDGRAGVRSTRGSRTIPIGEFAAGYMTPAIEPDELVDAVEIRIPAGDSGQCFLEFARRHGDFAIASVAAVLEADPSGRIAKASIAVGGVAAVPVRLAAAETALVGNVPNPDLYVEAAADCREIDALDDAITPGWYRRQVAGVLVERALSTAWQRLSALRGAN
jgi:carbon-monoxide dehydrogenase medium subunit